MNSDIKAAVFLDRDGTIIEDRGHLREPSEAVFFPETFRSLRALQKHFLLFIVTNQSGIAQGVTTRKEVDCVNAHVVATLADEGVNIRDVYVCPHGRADGCRCIKPKPYFLRKAARSYGIDLRASFSVGDHPHDVQFARNVGGRGIYVLTGHGRKHLNELPEGTETATGIAEAAEMVLSRPATATRGNKRNRMNAEFVLNLMVARDLWMRRDLGHASRDTRRVAEVLKEAGIGVHRVCGGWLECEPRPVGIHEALSGRSASSDWIKQFNCPVEQPGRVLRLLAEKGIPVCDAGNSCLEGNLQGDQNE